MNSPIIIDWIEAFRNRTRVEKQEAIAECYQQKIRTAGCCLNLIDLHGLWPESGEDAWQSFVAILKRQADAEDRSVALQFATRTQKRPIQADKAIQPRQVPVETPRAPVASAVDLYKAFRDSFAKHGVVA